ncbi:MAG: chemotaxis response regulator protein-glutamate methylesterase [Rhodocyclaceae bacterium]|nr:chemotaxis response regulator protein-glutamate methylesterase [Rhodocyclaceae bacterium]MDZ4215208.1 chemotaxis response regulator protein-glutamate methylesterase [Rhodocyclaceae bacterium]
MAIKVLIVDDSALMRALLTEIIGGAPDLDVVGAAPDAIAARDMIKVLNPDVLTLDVEMPKMDGLEFLGRLMKLRPMPVVMISSLTAKGSEVTLQALELGAVDFVAKPRAESATLLQAYAEEIRDKIRAAKTAHLRRPSTASAAPAPRMAVPSGLPNRVLNEKMIAIGASTGGTEAIKEVLVRLPAEMPGIVMVQHMPETFTPSFAKRLDGLSALRVIEAQGGERIQPGHAYLAPGHSHLTVKRSGNGWVTELNQNEPVNRHRPAVDVLFSSVAKEVGRNAIGVILTGMGKDGAQGMLAMRRAGAWNIGQDQESCVVYGMPREAALVGAVDEVVSLNNVAPRVLARLQH